LCEVLPIILCKEVEMTQGQGKKKRWTAEEDAAVRNGVKHLPGRSNATIRARRIALGVSGNAYPSRCWTPEEDKFLLENYKVMTNKQMAEALDRVLGSVRNRVIAIGACGDRTQKDWALRGPNNPNWKGGSRSREFVKGYQARRRAKSEMNMTEEDKNISLEYRLAIQKDPCYFCSKRTNRMQTDHLFPIAKGGTDHWWNLVRSCSECNHKKATRCGTKFKLLGV
jgi:5-methylcytosine-specific restriction endonuclease McrA